MRFYIALWAAKFAMFCYKLMGRERDDRPGLLATKICPDFLTRIHKPKLVITITGTNGKTTTSALINNKLRESGLTTSFNDWGANLTAGYSLNLMRCVNIFNRPVKDASILEADELTLDETMTQICPNYILITNICKDSLRRNGHPENIFKHIDRTLKILGNKTKAILNANDPLSSQLGLESQRVYYGMTDIGAEPFKNMVADIAVCPKCSGEIGYDYRLYRHLGGFYCKDCDFKMAKAKYFAKFVDYDNRKICIDEDGEDKIYPLISDTLFNAFNVLSAVAVLREVGEKSDDISRFLESQKITAIRETCVEFNGIEYYAYAAKSQNVSAASTVFEYMAKEPSDKNVVLLLDEVQDRNHPTETITWLYETDFEFLNSDNIKKILVGGHMFLNHKLRLLLAGIPEEKIVAVEEEKDIIDYVDREGIEKVYVLYEIDCLTKAKNMRDAIVLKAKEVYNEKG